MKQTEVDIIVKEDGVYEVKMTFPKERFSELLKDNYGQRDNLGNRVTEVFAKKFVEENFAELKKLIDMDLIKLLATRKLANIVAGD